MVPLLMQWARFDQRRASATSLVAIVPTAVVGAAGYGIGGQVDLLAGAIIGAGALAGAPLGAILLRRLPLMWLRWMLITALLGAAAYLVLVTPERGATLEVNPLIALGLAGLGLLMGVLSGLFGIGGGIVAVPVLIALFGMSDLLAKGTSLIAMIPAAVSGSIANVRAGLVRVREGLLVGIAAVAFSTAGVALAFLIPAAVAGWLFAALLVYSAGQLVWRTLRGR